MTEDLTPDDIDITQRLDEDLYGAADMVVVESELATFADEFYKQELKRDTGDLTFRPPVIGINHKSGTFDMSGTGIEDYAPKELKGQVIDHAKNRALWQLKQDPNNKMPLCSSFDAKHGSLKMPDGSPVPCAKCVFGQWWKPGDLLQLAKTKGPKSAAASVLKYIEANLAEHGRSVQGLFDENPQKNIPPPCKEVRRLFLFAYDYANKGILNAPVILQVPTSSVGIWDKYRQDLALRTIQLQDGRRVPMVLTAVITSITLEKTEKGNQIWSKVAFSLDRTASAKMTKRCVQIRDERADDVMKFQMTLADFDLKDAVDPTSFGDLGDTPDSSELGTDIVLDDEGDPLEDI